MDPQNAGAPLAGDPAQSPSAQAAGGAQPNPVTPEPDDGDQQMSLAEARKLRSEHAALRKRLKEFEDAKAAAEAASMTENERTKKQLADKTAEHDAYRTTMQERFVALTIQQEAARLGIVDPSDATKLLDWSELEYDDDGVPTNAAKLLAALAKAKPYLVGKAAPATAGGATNPPRSAVSGNGGWDMERYRQLVRTPGAYQALSPSERAELSTWLTTQRR